MTSDFWYMTYIYIPNTKEKHIKYTLLPNTF